MSFARTFALVVVAAILCEVAFAMKSVPLKASVSKQEENVGSDPLCGLCIDFALAGINDLLNIIANAGILGECGDLCGKLTRPWEKDVCDVACDAVGLDEFIKILERSDIDPIWMCELVKMCTVVDCQGTCLTIESEKCIPPKVPVGGKLDAIVEFQVEQLTGTGMTRIDLYDPQGNVNQDDSLEIGFKPGNYSLDIQIDTSGGGFSAGQYTLQVWFCEGECGSHHPHSKVYDVKNTTFLLT